MLKKSLSILLTLVMLLGVFAVLPATASAADADLADEGAVVKHYDIITPDIHYNINETLKVGDSITISFREASTKGELKLRLVGGYGLDKGIVSVTDIVEDKRSVGSYPRTYTITALKPGKDEGLITIKYFNIDTYAEGQCYADVNITVTGSSTSSSSSSLATPKITKGTSVDTGMKLTWGSVSGAAKYRVYKKVSGKWKKLGDTTSTSYTDKSVKSGGSYTYTVRCINSAATKFTSSYNKTGFKYTYNMATPKKSSITNSTSGVKISWGAVTNAKKYRVYYKGSKGWVKLGDTTSTSITDKKIALGSTRTYTVRCINSAATKFTSSYNKTGWKHTRYLTTPKISGSEITTSGVKLKWGAVSGAAKYRVYRKVNGKWKKLGDTTATSFTDKKATRNKTNVYTVRCINAAANKFTSSYDSAGYKVVYSTTPKILNVRLDESDDTVCVDIDDAQSDRVSYYKIWYKSGSGWIYVGQTSGRWIIYPSVNLSIGRTYTFTVQGFDSSGNTVTSYEESGFPIYVTSY